MKILKDIVQGTILFIWIVLAVVSAVVSFISCNYGTYGRV